MWKYGLLHFLILAGTFGYFSFWVGVLFLIVVVNLFDFVIEKYGYQRMNYGDLIMTYEKPGCNHNLVGYIIMDKIDFESFRDTIYERGVKNVFKMRTKMVKALGISFWKDLGNEEARKQLIKADTNIHTEEDAMKHINKLANKYMDYDRPLWEFYLQEDYSKTESLFFLRLHHAFADAGGFVGMMSMINDAKYQLKIAKKIPQPNIFHHIFFSIVGPFYMNYVMLKWRYFRNSDENASKCEEINGPVTYENKFYSAKSRIPFDKIRA